MAPLRRKKNRKPQIIPFQSKEGGKNILEGLNKNPMMLVVVRCMKGQPGAIGTERPNRPTACKKKLKKRRKRECIRKREKGAVKQNQLRDSALHPTKKTEPSAQICPGDSREIERARGRE